MGIEPTWPAWKAGALPLSYTRLAAAAADPPTALRSAAPDRPLDKIRLARGAGGGGRIRTYVGIRRQIYSLLPLTTRPPLRVRTCRSGGRGTRVIRASPIICQHAEAPNCGRQIRPIEASRRAGRRPRRPKPAAQAARVARRRARPELAPERSATRSDAAAPRARRGLALRPPCGRRGAWPTRSGAGAGWRCWPARRRQAAALVGRARRGAHRRATGRAGRGARPRRARNAAAGGRGAPGLGAAGRAARPGRSRRRAARRRGDARALGRRRPRPGQRPAQCRRDPALGRRLRRRRGGRCRSTARRRRPGRSPRPPRARSTGCRWCAPSTLRARSTG